MDEAEEDRLELAAILRRLQDWLMVILEEPHRHGLIAEYSQHCFDLGIHAHEIFQEVVTPEDIFTFHWMKPWHQQLLVTKVYMPYKGQNWPHDLPGV